MVKSVLITLERRIFDMALFKEPETRVQGIKEKAKKAFGWLVQLGIVLGAFSAIFTQIASSTIDNKLKAHTESIEKLFNEKINGVGIRIEALGDDIRAIDADVATIKKDFYKPYGPAFSSDLTPAEDFVHYATLSYITQDSPIKENNATFLSSKSLVAYSMVADEAYTVEQVADERLFLPYIEDGQEIYFLGQLSTNGNWDGNCIINIYKNDELQLITDAMYDDGELLTCKQIFPYTTTNDKIDVWAVSKRTAKNEFSSGETLYFVREGEYIKQFAFETAHAEDVLSVNDFKQFLTGYQEGYYYGNTSNGQFNDDTSTAYMVKYFPDGTVKTLYVGKFQNGQFEDDSGNAWLIGKKEMGAPYYYYHEGPFENGEMIKDPKYWDKGISQQEINKLIKGYSFNCNLNWG